MHVGAIDIGSNSIRLLVADVEEPDGRMRVIVRAGEVCRLGRGLAQNGLIEAGMVERACELVDRMAKRARAEGAERVIVAATHALRQAANRAEVLARLQLSAGVPVRVLGGEAALIYGAVVESLGPRAARLPCVVFDLGGGSTEVASGVGLVVGRAASLPIGAVSLTERWLGQDPPERERVEMLDQEVMKHLMSNCAHYPSSPNLLAGVGGTVTVLASLYLDLRHYDPTRIDGCLIPAAVVESLADQLTWMTPEMHRRVGAMGEGRADIVAAGARVALGLLRFFQARSLTASSQGLRYALARLAARERRAGQES
jgi:exopolyphosphatase/guanosine-5'-triphosphate,3'-diphosphate pyrophosphatase